MQYTVEDVSAVRKKVAVTVPAEEVNAAITSTIAMYRTSVTFDGFRKGKAPLSLVEKRFKDKIYEEATTELVNVHINEIIGELKVTPVSRIDFDGKELERNADYTYSFSFDIMPEVTIPAYEGFEVEQEEAVVNDDEIESVIERLRNDLATEETVMENRHPQSGDIAIIDFAAFDEEGNAIPGIKADNFQMHIGQNQTLPDFEKIVCSLKASESGEGTVVFPDDFFNPEFAGKTVIMKVTLHALKARILPELNDDLAQKAGHFENMDKLRDTIRQSYMHNREELNKSSAQVHLLQELLKMTEFPIPESMLEANLNNLIEDVMHKLAKQGKDLSFLGKTEEQLKEELTPEAEMRTKSHIFLLSLAQQKDLSVSEQEVDAQLQRIAMQTNEKYEVVKDYYINNNLIFALRDKILADKAMDLIYKAAKVTVVPPKPLQSAEKAKETTENETAAGTKDASAKDKKKTAKAEEDK